ncbi:glucose dehydrogenase [uncultured Jannaschia sp.]|uniref:glucose dehydrogenase n=1 Tax=uncultured Jannaschia sp. TaxID=293347 RepID=UPI00261FBBDF|nr:glucose dehydrogenase [uncultured Jannaschia sp.]
MKRRPDRSPHRGAGYWTRVAIALLFGVLGTILLIGGVWLIALGGSWYYALAGLGLLVSAWFLWRGQMAALAVYALVWAFTLAWTIWEVRFDWWAWVPRMVAPTVLLVVVLASLPLLSQRRAARPHHA